jgi:hypothetical protein
MSDNIIRKAIKSILQRRNNMPTSNTVPTPTPTPIPTPLPSVYTINNGITNAGYYSTTAPSTMWNTSVSSITNSNFTVTGNITSATNYHSSAISISSNTGKEIVRLNRDGTVTWNDEIDVDEAAKAFALSISLGAEMVAGITYAVKQRMRDAVFDELIEMVKDKGTLNVDDLTYLHKAAKIMDKLKGKE